MRTLPCPQPPQPAFCSSQAYLGRRRAASLPRVSGPVVVAGTRITVEHILDELAHGQPIDALVDSPPYLDAR